jgi:endonuclease/exonuclease/phosphatase (EEP) superfamily protein YafD
VLVIVLGRKLALASLLILWCALLAATLGRYLWLLDLFSHFRVQYTMLFLIVAIMLFAMRRPGLAVVSIIGAVLSAIPIVSYLGVPPARAAAGSANFRIVAFNTWFRNHDYAAIGRFLEQAQADVVVLEELSRQQAADLSAYLSSYPHSHMPAQPRRYGAVVFARWPILAAEPLALAEGPARAAKVTLDWRGTPVTVLGVHLHWPLGPTNSRLRNQELEGIASFAAATPGPLIVAGDFNVTPWSSHFREALARSALNDCAAGQGLAPSWPAQAPPLGIRIDHCWASKHWRTTDVRTGPGLGSDHLPLIADLVLAPQEIARVTAGLCHVGEAILTKQETQATARKSRGTRGPRRKEQDAVDARSQIHLRQRPALAPQEIAGNCKTLSCWEKRF